jgi:hypothetical protein
VAQISAYQMAGCRRHLGLERLAFGQDPGGALRQARPLSLKDMRRDVRWKSVAPSLALSLATAFDTNYFKDIP